MPEPWEPSKSELLQWGLNIFPMIKYSSIRGRNSIKTESGFYGGFPSTSAGKESSCNTGDCGLIPGLGRPPGGRPGNPL